MVITPQNTLKSQYQLATITPDFCKHPAIVGGFGSGKTKAIPLRCVSLIEWRARYQKIKAKIMVVEPSKEMVRDILVPAFDEFFDSHGIKHSYHKTYHDYKIRYKGYNFTFLFRSSDIPASLTGKDLTDVILDEFDKKHSIANQKDIWKECISRIRKSPFGTVTPVTTPEGFKYTYELYNECQFKEIKNFKLFKAKTYDNFFLPADFVENLYAQFSPELVAQYIEAEFINIMQGKAYYSFNREYHVKKVELNKNGLIELMFDYNINPMTTSIGQVRNKQNEREQDRVLQIGKTLNSLNSNTPQHTKEVKQWLSDNMYNGNLLITGDATNRKTSNSNYTDWELVKAVFPPSDYVKYEVASSNPAVKDRVNAVNSKMRNYYGKIGLVVNNEGCEPLIKDFEQVTWKEGKSELDKSNPALTHNSDNVGYKVWQEFPLRNKPETTWGKAV